MRSSRAAVCVATKRPAAPPIDSEHVLSISTWRIRRERGAPSATRMEVWPASAAPRASWRLARLAQAISSTRPVMPISSRRSCSIGLLHMRQAAARRAERDVLLLDVLAVLLVAGGFVRREPLPKLGIEFGFDGGDATAGLDAAECVEPVAGLGSSSAVFPWVAGSAASGIQKSGGSGAGRRRKSPVARCRRP